MAWFLAALALMTGYLLFCDILYRIICDREFPVHRLPKPRDRDGFSPWKQYRDEIERGVAWFSGQPYEQVSIESFDGLKLTGQYLPSDGADRTLLLLHGYRSDTASFDFSCALKAYHDLGFNILLVDQRAHGASGGRYIGFGVPERQDVKAWAWYLHNAHRPRQIILDGMSMGAATVLMALSLDLPPSVAGAIADSGYTTPKAIIRHVARSATKLPFAWLWPGLMLIARARSGYALHGASTTESLRAAKVPVLLVHGEEDRFVPCAMAQENYAACASRATLFTVPGAGHGVSYMVDRDGLTRALNAFLDRIDAPDGA